MKKLTIQLLTIAIAVFVFSVTEAVAQKRVNLDRNGKATIDAVIKPWKVEEGEKPTWSISGKKFNNLSIKQTKGEKFKYEIRRGNEILSSGHTTGSNIQIRSDGASVYTISIINERDEAGKIVLSIKDLEAEDR
jgi:hypothetical protein